MNWYCGIADTTKHAAKALEAQGVEVVSADLNDRASLSAAIKGSYAVFAVTNYWEFLNADKETEQGKRVVDAAKEHSVQHLIFSTLLNVEQLTKGEFAKVYHFDSKARIADYMREQGVPYTEFQPGFFM